jgi:intraflagellar transport protein 140
MNTKIAQFSINEKVVDAICKPSAHEDPEKDFRELARAAVSGDENALEAFDYKRSARGKPTNKLDSQNKPFYGAAEAICFIIGGDKGSVFFINENVKFIKLYQMDGQILKLLYNQERSLLVSITDTLMLSQYILKPEGEAANIMTVKLNGRSQKADFTWVGNNLLAYVSGEGGVRFV